MAEEPSQAGPERGKPSPVHQGTVHQDTVLEDTVLPGTQLGARFTRFAGAALVALAATEIALTVGNGALHLTAAPAALVSWFAGAVVSYALTRWAWNRTGRPDLLRETLPFWGISAAVVAILTLANKFGYRSAAWLHLTGARHVLWVDLIWLAANLGTFLLRFAVFHYLLFADPPGARRESRAADGTHYAPQSADVASAPAA